MSSRTSTWPGQRGHRGAWPSLAPVLFVRALFVRVLLVQVLVVPLRAGVARADSFVPSEPRRVVLGALAGTTAASGVNGARNRSAERPLPAALGVSWSRRVAGGVASNIVVDGHGNLFIAGFGRVTELDESGALRFSRAEPFSRAALTALLNDGTRVVLSEEHRLIGLSAAGTAVFELQLRGSDDAAPTLLPLWDGGLLVSLGSWVFAYGADGGLRSSKRLNEAVRVSLQLGKESFLVGVRGSVQRWDGYAEPTLVAQFSGPVLDAAGAAGGAIVALLAGNELVELLLPSRRLHELSLLEPALDAAIRATEAGWLATGTSAGRLLLLPKAAALPSEELARNLPRITALPGALWLSAPGATVLVAAPSEPLTLYSATESRQEIPAAQCPDPVSLVPAGVGRVALACRAGQVWLLAATPREMPAPPVGGGATGQ